MTCPTYPERPSDAAPGEELQAALERLPPRLRHFDPRFDAADDYMRRAEAAVAERAARSAAPAKP